MRWKTLLLLGAALALGFTLSVEVWAGPKPSWASRGPHPVASLNATLVDSSRPTAPNGSFEGAPARTLKTTVWYPAAPRPVEPLRWGATPADPIGAPLIVYSHGFMSFRDEGRYLAEHLASHGFVVVAANFPLSNYFAPGDPTVLDVVNQPGDLSFLMDQVVTWSGDPGHPLAGAVDGERFGAVGMSLGGLTTTLVTFHPRWRDPRLDVAVSLAGPSAMFGPGFYAGKDTPFLMIGGTLDAMVDYESNAAVIPARVPQGSLATVEGGAHINFVDIAHPWLALVDNGDHFGCRALRKNLPEGVDGYERFIRALGTPEEGLVEPPRAFPCDVADWERAVRPRLQHEITQGLVLSFLEAHLAEEAGRREQARTRFLKEVPAAYPELSLVSDEPPSQPQSSSK